MLTVPENRAVRKICEWKKKEKVKHVEIHEFYSILNMNRLINFL